MRVWIDIENPPQVQYLLPLRSAFQAAGAEVLLTARDYGSTLTLLEQAGADFESFGNKVGRGRWRKGAAGLRRSVDLLRFLAGAERPDALVCASRAAALAARRLGIASFIITDYEYAHTRIYRWTGSTLLHPDVIQPTLFHEKGIRRTIAFRGIKEDLTFADVDVDAVREHPLPGVSGDVARVLFRPPSETSHYYNQASSEMARRALGHLAGLDAVLVFTPRESEQVRYLEAVSWRHEPVVLERPVPFVSLLKAVDAVVCSGGTMLREAAYLGIPAYSIFQSEIGAVDRWLAGLGRVTLLGGPEDFARIKLERRGSLERLDANPNLRQELVELVLGAVNVPVLAGARG